MSKEVDIQAMWKLMDESNAGTMMLKFFKKTGDKKPYRAMVFLQGEETVEAAIAALDALDEDA